MPANTLKPSAAKTTLRQLSVLGLPGPMLRDTIGTIFQRLVPCDLVSFLHLDDAGNFTDAWISLHDILSQFGVYLDQYYNGKEAEAAVSSDAFYKSSDLIDRMHGGDNYLKSDLYQEVFRHCDMRFAVRAAMRDGTTARGLMAFTRGHKARDFNAQELRLTQEVTPYITHALHAPQASSKDVDSVEVAEGQLICSPLGQVEYASAQGKILLHAAADVALTGASVSDSCCSWAAPLLKRLVAQAQQLEGGKPGALPVIERNTAAGKFVLRAWGMAAINAVGTPKLYTISIRRYIPQALRLLQSPALQTLSAREQQVCLHLADGLETKEIARRMNITPHTAVHYVRTIYQRLGINSRADLLPRLMRPLNPH